MDTIEITINNYNGKRITYTMPADTHIDRYNVRTPSEVLYEVDIHFTSAHGIELKEEEI